MNMLLEEWNLDEAKEVWREEGLEAGLERGIKKTEAKYKPLVEEIRRENQELRRKLLEAGIDPR
jgi:hypothetical protein